MLWAIVGTNSARLGGRGILGPHVRPFIRSFITWRGHSELTVHRLYWVGQFGTRSKRQPRWPLFFHVDWTPEILEAMKCLELPFGEHYVYPSYNSRLVAQSPLLISIAVLLALVEHVLYSNKLNGHNYYAQDSRPAGLPPGTFLHNWLLDAAVDLLRRPHRNYMSPLTMALLFITLPLLESSFLFLVP